MADPLSIAGLAFAVVQVATSVYDYVGSVKNAKEDIRRLSQEMFALKGTLDHMVAFHKSGGDDNHGPQMNAVIKLTAETLETIKKRLERRSTGLGRSVHVITWPFQKSDIDKLVAALERAKTWFMMTLMQDTTEQTRAVFSEVQHLTNIIHEDILSRQLDRMTQDVEVTIRGLSPVDPWEDHMRVSRDLVPGTGQWFMDKKFEEWAGDQLTSRPLLWVKGKSGAGKSSLFSSVVDELKRRCSPQPKQLVCCFFYCHSGNAATQVPVNVFGSLLAQLCEIRPEMASEIRPLLRPGNRLIAQTLLSISDLARLLTSALESIERCYMLVDALNETPHYRLIVSLLSKLSQICPSLRVLVTSTSNPPIKGKQILLRQMGESAVDHDIGVYVEHRLTTESSFGNLSERIKMEIKTTMTTLAHGMFRWAQLGMDRLSKLRTGRDVLIALKDMPSTLNDTYTMLLQRISPHDHNIALNAFTWVSFSVQKLTLRELAEAVVLEESDRDLDDDFRLTDPVTIIEVCCGLLELESGYVTLAHDSIRSFFMSESIKNSPVAEFALDPATSHRKLMKKCLAHLMFNEFTTGILGELRELVSRCRRYPLSEYAAICWPVHAENTTLDPGDEKLILDFFDTKLLPNGGNFDSWVQVLHSSVNKIPIRRTEPLYYAASYNMVPIVKLLLRPGSKVNVNQRGGRFGSTPFLIACFRGHSEVAKLLLAAGANPNTRDGGNGRTALELARHRGMDEVVRMIENRPASDGSTRGAAPRMSESTDTILCPPSSRPLILGPWWNPGDEEEWDINVPNIATDDIDSSSGLI